jgi:benzoyl-CoA reductase/2-hydroxyglutaryl-CoA dehydratase subunit BcrC/BadD/HgdB
MVGTWLEEAKRSREEEKKVIIVPFNFPPEILHAFENAFPITSEVLTTLGVVALEGQGERYWDYAMGLGLPDHLCSANAVELGSMLTGADFKPDAIVSSAPGSCDVNSKIHEFAALHLGIPQLLLEKPTDDTRRGREMFKKNFFRLVRDLENFIGEELKEENLREVAERANRATELYYDLWELRKQVPCPVPGIFSLFTYGCRFAMWGREESIAVLEKCVENSKRNLENPEFATRKEIARSVWLYTSYYFDFTNFYGWFEGKGISHLLDALTCFFPQVIDTTSRETILEGIAESAWNMPMTRQMGSVSMSMQWLDDMILAIKDLGATAAIYCGHHACKQTWSVFSQVRNEIMKRTGVPTLCLQGDCWIRRMTPMSVLVREMEQFIDNVVAKRRRKRKGPGQLVK